MKAVAATFRFIDQAITKAEAQVAVRNALFLPTRKMVISVATWTLATRLGQRLV